MGLTRARKKLYLSRSEYRSSWGAPTYNPPSRFLSEIPEAVISWNVSSASLKPRSVLGGPTRTFGPPPKATGKRIEVTLELAVGDRVSHDTFGMGKVVGVAGAGDRAEATIDFGSTGEKRLLLRYAPVEKL